MDKNNPTTSNVPMETSEEWVLVSGQLVGQMVAKSDRFASLSFVQFKIDASLFWLMFAQIITNERI